MPDRLSRFLVVCVIPLGLLVFACTATNPAWCNHDQDCRDPGFPVCDTRINSCVPAGDAGTGQDADGDAGSGDSAGDGFPLDAIFVDDDTCPRQGSGTQADPYCQIRTAVQRAAGDFARIVIAPGTYAEDLQLNKDLHLQGAPGTVIETNSCPGILVSGRVTVILESLQVRGSSGVRAAGGATLELLGCRIENATCIGVDCAGTDATESHCRLSRNWILGCELGGVRLVGSGFRLENNVIANNGEDGPFGGVWIEVQDQQATFTNNTVTDNNSLAAGSEGISCLSPSAPVRVANSILWENGANDVTGDCQVDHSDVSQAPGTFEGSDNISSDPLFVDEYHIAPTSPCRDLADPAVAPADDIDGEERPQGTGVDTGADEIP